MNHDYEHCIDFKDDCPESCHRAQLVRDLEQNYPPSRDVSWMNFGDFPDCQRNRLANSSPKVADNIGDLVSRSSLLAKYDKEHEGPPGRARKLIEDEPPAQSEIVYCKDCVKHNKGLGNYEVHPDGSTTWIWKDSACPLVSWRDKAQGHEFDYQFCAYAERSEET